MKLYRGTHSLIFRKVKCCTSVHVSMLVVLGSFKSGGSCSDEMEKCLLGTRKGFPPLCLCYPNQSLHSFILWSASCSVSLSPKDGDVSVVVRDSCCAAILTRKSKNLRWDWGSSKGKNFWQGKKNTAGQSKCCRKKHHSVADVFWAWLLTLDTDISSVLLSSAADNITALLHAFSMVS